MTPITIIFRRKPARFRRLTRLPAHSYIVYNAFAEFAVRRLKCANGSRECYQRVMVTTWCEPPPLPQNRVSQTSR